ncbi:nuclear transport factor 2 family protein [Ideonella sp.]|uniref:nuclear transport factor 2 family protein n=1 Tax=Ideonella sp. TaxID=1929293 RepID=UPI0035B1C930
MTAGLSLASLPRRFARPLLAACMACLPALAAAATTEEELRAVEDQRQEAIRIQDFATLGRIYAPEFVAVDGSGQVIDRSQLFQVFAKGGSAQKFSTDEIRVLDLGETAVFIGRLVARAPTGVITYSARFSHVFVRRDGHWLCVSGQSTTIPEP